jgi:signal transduction histidine kinase
LLLSNDHQPETGDQRPEQHPRSASQEVTALLTTIHHQISDLLRELPTATALEVSRLGLVDALRRAVTDEWGRAFDGVEWGVEPEAEVKTKTIPALTAEVLFYAAREAIRNAARHGRAEMASPLHLKIVIAWRDGLEMIVEDNGVGLVAAGSTNGGSGQGLALHSTMMAVIGGTLAVESAPGVYTRVTLSLPQPM